LKIEFERNKDCFKEYEVIIDETSNKISSLLNKKATQKDSLICTTIDFKIKDKWI